jgi:tetratricopeptide (TPR) repeat protein
MGDITNAAEFSDKSFELSHNIDDKLTLADIYKTKGIIERHLQNYNESENFLLSSIRLNTRLKNEQNIAESSFELAVLYQEINKAESKNVYLKKSLDFFKKINAADKVNTIENMLVIGTA